ncbi:MAG: B-box zinc finger protein [Victivallales bacterium]|nr:B-box zinc finger protein [Victivallales bacterium]MBQ6472396.1 B-box zinc finger protein [Victivallales bacterium]
MANLNNGPVCINHHDRPAVAHCASCRRPICEDCLVEKDGFKCCSRECLQTALASTAITNDILSRRRSAGGKAVVGTIVKWVVIAAVIVAAIYFKVPQKVLGWFNSKKSQVQQMQQQDMQKMKNRWENDKNFVDQQSNPNTR